MTDKDMLAGLVARLRGPAYWMCGSNDGHEGESAAPTEAANQIERLIAELGALATRANSAQVDLTDPVTVHANMLRGTIAKPTWGQIRHLYPAETAALVGAAYEVAAKAIDARGIEEQANFGLGRETQNFYRARDIVRALTPADAQAALDAALKKARREGLEMGYDAGFSNSDANWNGDYHPIDWGEIEQYEETRAAAIRKLGDGE